MWYYYFEDPISYGIRHSDDIGDEEVRYSDEGYKTWSEAKLALLKEIRNKMLDYKLALKDVKNWRCG